MYQPPTFCQLATLEIFSFPLGVLFIVQSIGSFDKLASQCCTFTYISISNHMFKREIWDKFVTFNYCDIL